MSIENLWYRYPRSDKWALKNINLKVDKGEFIVLTGPSGCGKSTLALTIVGYIPHVIERGEMRGNVFVKGVNTRKKELHELTQLVGIVLQNPEDQLFALTVEEDVAFGPENLALPKEEIRRRVDKAMKDAGVWEIRHKEIFALSGGQKQRTAIAGILAMEPEILIFDEPTSDLDPQGAYSVLSIISEIQERRDVTVILIEHRLDEVSKYADRIILMDKGEIIIDAEPHKAYKKLDEFLKRGVRPPQVSEAVFKYNQIVESKDSIIPITLEEAESIFRQILNGKIEYPLELEDKLIGGKEPIISFKDVWVRYPDGTVAVKGVSLDIFRGEMVAIIGKNGSGKSTLMSLTAGLNKPWKG
ncbi:MAG: ABC transporter ATP-binding protein, partial [Thermoprotei archaeon]